MMENSNKLFISHSEKDREIISAFVDLLYDIGLKEENMFCSSRTDIGVPIKEDIYEYLRRFGECHSYIYVVGKLL